MNEIRGMRKRLMEAARMGPSQYLAEYTSSLSEIIEFSLGGLGSGLLRCRNLSEVSASLKATLLYRDETVLDWGFIDSREMTMNGFGSSFFKGQPVSITFPRDNQTIKEAVEKGRVSFAFSSPAGDEAERTLSDLAPLIERGRVAALPRRLLFYHDGVSETPEGGRVWSTIDAKADAAVDSWIVKGENKPQLEPTITSSVLPETGGVDTAKTTLVLPYIANVSLSDYALILEDESDIILDFRKSISDLVKEAGSGADVDQIRQDVVDPRIRKIERSYQRISSQYRLRTTGAAISTVALTLVSYGSAGLAAAVTAAAGAAGLVASVREIADRREKLAALRDDPLHLLWRLQQQTAAPSRE